LESNKRLSSKNTQKQFPIINLILILFNNARRYATSDTLRAINMKITVQTLKKLIKEERAAMALELKKDLKKAPVKEQVTKNLIARLVKEELGITNEDR